MLAAGAAGWLYKRSAGSVAGAGILSTRVAPVQDRRGTTRRFFLLTGRSHLKPDFADAYLMRGTRMPRRSENGPGAMADFSKTIELRPR